MELIQAVKQILGGDRAFADADVAQGTLAAEVIDLVRGAVKDEAVKDANDAAKELMSGLEQKEADLTKAEDAFKGTDVEMLPAGNTAWRMSNAISWVANGITDADKRLEVERAAGKVIDLEMASVIKAAA